MLSQEEYVYQALTKIRVRKNPDINGPLLTDKTWVATIENGTYFEVKGQVRDRDAEGNIKQRYLKLMGEDGWVFAQGISGEWAGKDIVVPVPEDDVWGCRVQALLEVAKRKAGRFSVKVTQPETKEELRGDNDKKIERDKRVLGLYKDIIG